MIIKLDARLKSFGEAGYVAWINNPNGIGMVVQADTPEKAAKELVTSVKVKFAYDWGIDIDGIEEKQFNSEQEMQAELVKELKETGKHELKFQLA